MQPTFIIAEVGVNHNGIEDIAIELIDGALEAGADAVKFQTFNSSELATQKAMKAPYQEISNESNQLEMLKKLELSFDVQKRLKEYCEKKGITFMSTAFDKESLDFLLFDLDISILKIPSGELNNHPLLLDFSKAKRKMILSTGMSTMDEIEESLGVIAFGLIGDGKPSKESFANAFKSSNGKKMLRKFVTLLHCSSQYPTPLDDSNIRVMETLKKYFGLSVGFSDHTQDMLVAITAASLGATIIEKHITLDKEMMGPDHMSSSDINEFKDYVASIRKVERILGSKKKTILKGEISNRKVSRKSLVAKKAIKKNELFTEENITTKRPGDGMSPKDFWRILGKKSKKKYIKDDQIDE